MEKDKRIQEIKGLIDGYITTINDFQIAFMDDECDYYYDLISELRKELKELEDGEDNT